MVCDTNLMVHAAVKEHTGCMRAHARIKTRNQGQGPKCRPILSETFLTSPLGTRPVDTFSGEGSDEYVLDLKPNIQASHPQQPLTVGRLEPESSSI